jgi:cell division transport system ATP-binding protein
MLNLVHVFKSYKGGIQALVDINIRVEKGEIVIMSGPTGSGKSVLLRVASGIESPTRGDVIIDGKDLRSISRGEFLRLRRKIGISFHSGNLFPKRTVFSNLFNSLIGRGLRLREIEIMIMRILNRFEMSHRRSVLVQDLSWGEQKLVALAQVFAFEPPLLFLDEPFEGLDDGGRDLCISEIKNLCNGGSTIILAAKDKEISNFFPSRIVHLSQGKTIGEQSKSVSA